MDDRNLNNAVSDLGFWAIYIVSHHFSLKIPQTTLFASLADALIMNNPANMFVIQVGRKTRFISAPKACQTFYYTT
jgi:hypothetical protein